MLNTIAVCVYSAGVPWSDCDPESMLRSKTVDLKKASSSSISEDGSKTSVQQPLSSDIECPRARILTKDCKIQELPKGGRQKISESRRVGGGFLIWLLLGEM
jgi:hypothetical protein